VARTWHERHAPGTGWTPLAGVTGLVVLLALGLGLVGRAAATHAPDHRFIVLGFVKGLDGRGLPDEAVTVTRLKTGLRYRGHTDQRGFYLVVVHLHDEDEGERLGVATRGMRTEVVARFEVAEKKLERGTRLDFHPDGPAEDRAAFAATLREFLEK
jgi:hypothetical protein